MAIESAIGSMAGAKLNPSLGTQSTGMTPGPVSGAAAGPKEGAEFKRALEQIAAQMPSGGMTGALPARSPNANVATSGKELKFSNHAIERMRSRGIGFQPEEMTKISNAISKAAAKGAKDTLILSGDNALIVSVKNNTVVTVMDRAAMKENVFTNIDSTVVI